MKKILIVDAFGLIFRAYYALIRRPLFTSKGFPTSAIMGFWKMLFSAYKELEPDEIVITLDSPGPSFRKERYELYKANREEAPEDLKIQIKYIVEMMERGNIPHLVKPKYEADDLIAYLVKEYKSDENEVYVLSSDKDLAQLVSQNVFMAGPEKGIAGLRILDEEGVFEKFGVYPHQMIDYLALVGDTSDNIPGVKGVGPKTAVKLIAEYNHLDGIYENIEQIKSESLKKKLRENKENAYLSYELVQLENQLDDVNFQDIPKEFNQENLYFLQDEFQTLEFKALVNDDMFSSLEKRQAEDLKTDAGGEYTLFGQDLSVDDKIKKLDRFSYHLILNKKDLNDLKKRIIDQKWVVFDTETTSENVLKAELIGASFALKEKEAYYVPLFDQNPAEFSKKEFFEIFNEVFSQEEILKIGQNVKYDYKVLAKYIPVRGIYFDTMIAAYLIDPDAKRYNMDTLATKFLNRYQTLHYNELVSKNKTLLDVDLNDVKNYACEDVDITLRLYHVFKSIIKKNELDELFYQIEMPLVPILAHMELWGIGLSIDRIKEIQVDLEDEIGELENQIYALAGLEFNLNSPKQVGQILFEKMNLPVIKKTKTGYSTDESVLERLKDYEIAEKLLNYRKYHKLLTTYAKALPRFLFENRIHTSFHQTGTATGRLSSTDPNLQNIPVREDIGRKIRSAFISSASCQLVSIDYSQIELRLMAHFSKDKNLIDAFLHDKDVHRVTASTVFHFNE